ncbi:MAG: MFS transporter [Muribaculaceae bacterium]|nr:MFS transporter [Muribaculaceae bacterium]
MNNNTCISPWKWIPSLYIAEGIPYCAVNTLPVLFYCEMGISIPEITAWTGLLSLPWMIRPFWSPFVDIFSTKRRWTLAMQMLMTLCMLAVALCLPASFFFASTLSVFACMAFFSATHDIAADGFYMLALSEKQQADFVGIRSTFYKVATVLGQGGLTLLAGWLETRGMQPAGAWSIVFYCLTAVFFSIWLWHTQALPKLADDRPVGGTTVSDIVRNFGMTFVTFFKKPYIAAAIAFMLLFRLPEAMCGKMVAIFMKTPLEDGGLGLSLTEIGFANGTVGVIALLAGGVLGGVLIGKGGLRRWLWPMAMSLALPCVVYCLLAIWPTADFSLICVAVGFEQFGYGFGLTALMMYMIYFARGEAETSHYAFCIAFSMAGIMLPGMAAGWIFERISECGLSGFSGGNAFEMYFWFVMLCCLTTFVACAIAGPSIRAISDKRP